MVSFWRKIRQSINNLDTLSTPEEKKVRDASRYAFIDIETDVVGKTIRDIGAWRWDDAVYHSSSSKGLKDFLEEADFICGHNIIHHDAIFLFGEFLPEQPLVDTLYFSPLLFPERPYHRLLKDDKLLNDQLNNPVNDCIKAYHLLMEEVSAWEQLPENLRFIYTNLLKGKKEFDGFLTMVDAQEYTSGPLADLILETFNGKICSHADIAGISERYPCELSYALALITTTDYRSITPPWVLFQYPQVENIMRTLRHTRCPSGCGYCNDILDIHSSLSTFFGYDQFRTYDGEPLQEKAASAAVDGHSLLAIFPTGGGKSLTFQLPALMEGRTVHGLTVVISPLQSLMKDQIDNLESKGISDAVTINGLLDCISRSLAIKRVQEGDASLLYISPEMLRSKPIERILLCRNVVRFVIDEAHCFSSWGQDFRVDYLYIGKFIREYQKKKGIIHPIPVSCFTATAKQKVIQDICDYFKTTLNLNMEIYASSASRTNLHYSVIHVESDNDKYSRLRSLISYSSCPVIVYVSRTKRAIDLAQKLSRDGFPSLPFHGQMDSDKKQANQNAFMNDEVRIIVATSAFGMGIDKSDVGVVIHYDISDSLENYVQESGRAGRNPHLNARCYVLYCDTDLDKHFILLNQTKLSISEIQQIWKAVKGMTRHRPRACCSALEIARAAGWDDLAKDIETRVRTALAALEQAGYLERGNNVPQVFATGIVVKNVEEARKKITASLLFEQQEVEKAVRIIKSLITCKYTSGNQSVEAESRVDYLAYILGLSRSEVVSVIERMRQEGILADTKDITAYLHDAGDSEQKSRRLLERFARLEEYLLNRIPDTSLSISYKQLNDDALNEGIATATEKDIRTLLFFLSIKGYAHKTENLYHYLEITLKANASSIFQRFHLRLNICRFTLDWLFRLSTQQEQKESGKNEIKFSIVELLQDYNRQSSQLFESAGNVTLEDIEEALLYLLKIEALKLEGGFLVLYNAMEIKRLKDSKFKYKIEDYKMLNEFYKQKIQQIHIVGEYANLMVKDYPAALQYVQDYFQMDYKHFVSKYFQGNRIQEIERNITPQNYNKIFSTLSPTQMEIISDKSSSCIVVAAGPGSGKTLVLVHKLASLLILEDVKHEQLLMLTFSRSAAMEFKQRLMGLIGNAAHFVEINTFHSYCFDLLGRIGNLEDSKDVVARAAQMIQDGEVEPNRIGKTVLVIDEAQDMSDDEYKVVHALMTANEEMRVIAVGDDDQNIFTFRGSDSVYMRRLLEREGGRQIEMTENFRSARHIVKFANAFVKSLRNRMKQTPIISKSNSDGLVHITRYSCDYMYEPLVTQLLSNRGQGTIAVLTSTNEEAAIIVALLKKHGVRSQLIQSMGDFRFWTMAEVRYFLKRLENGTDTPIIPDKIWAEAVSDTCNRYTKSSCLHYLQRCIHLFETTNSTKYLTDFKEFISESSLEDFCDLSESEVVVSTIHKSKGHEFNDVYLLLSYKDRLSDSLLRSYYVGITRAKQRLFIHTNSHLFNNIPIDEYIHDRNVYDMPDEIVLELSHKDVNLGFFKSLKKDILLLRAGEELVYDHFFLYVPHTHLAVCQLSQKMQQEIISWEENGYSVTKATIRFIVSWRPKDAPREEKEHAVLLVDLTLNKNRLS